MNAAYPQRQHPVHMPPVERSNLPILLFVTMVLHPRTPCLADERFQNAFLLACRDAHVWSVGKYLIMPDHVHLFCQPAHEPRMGIKPWSSFLKRRISQHYGPHPWNWQNDVWDTQIRNTDHYREKWEYVRQNPLRKDLVERVEDWPWQGEMVVLSW